MSDGAPEGGGPDGGGADGGGEGRRRRRRRRGGGEAGETGGRPESGRSESARVESGAPAPAPRPERNDRGPRPEPRDARGGGGRAPGNDRGPGQPNREPRPERTERNDRGPRPERNDRGPRPDRPDPGPRPDRGPRPDPQPRRDDPRATQPPVDSGWDDDAAISSDTAPAAPPPPDDDGPAPPVTLGPDLPAEPPDDDLDPTTADLADHPAAALGEEIAVVLGVRLQPTGKIFWCDAGGGDYKVGDLVLVDGERSQRLATVAVAPARKPVGERLGRTVVRKATDADRAQQAREHARADEVLRLARDRARELRLPTKVFRVEYTQPPNSNGKGGKLNLYFTSDERIEVRELLRDLGSATGARIELRQVGVRDEAKHVGGIGSCGQELCCTTWLPDFVPVSIKMAKDQGLVLNPTKVSGQCGRLKCCLVYEQATYAEMRKGLPKLGKRVITAQREGRVVEVDVLRQRVRVAFGPGESQVMPANEVKPMFPAQHAHEPEPEVEPEAESE